MPTRRALFAAFAAALAAPPTDSHALKDRPDQTGALRQIRNATLHVNYTGVSFLIDPMLSDRRAFAHSNGFDHLLLTPGDGEIVVL